MKFLKYLASVILVSSSLSLAYLAKPAQAQVAYGSYIGVGGTVGVSDGTQVGGVLAVRYKLLETPISFRTQALIGENTAVVPMVSYSFTVIFGIAIIAFVAYRDRNDTAVSVLGGVGLRF